MDSATLNFDLAADEASLLTVAADACLVQGVLKKEVLEVAVKQIGCLDAQVVHVESLFRKHPCRLANRRNEIPFQSRHHLPGADEAVHVHEFLQTIQTVHRLELIEQTSFSASVFLRYFFVCHHPGSPVDDHGLAGLEVKNRAASETARRLHALSPTLAGDNEFDYNLGGQLCVAGVEKNVVLLESLHRADGGGGWLQNLWLGHISASVEAAIALQIAIVEGAAVLERVASTCCVSVGEVVLEGSVGQMQVTEPFERKDKRLGGKARVEPRQVAFFVGFLHA